MPVVEWLETNGRGGFACGTATGRLTRRWHGVLWAARHPPRDRVRLIAGFEESLVEPERRPLSDFWNGKEWIEPGMTPNVHATGGPWAPVHAARSPLWHWDWDEGSVIKQLFMPHGTTGEVRVGYSLAATAGQQARIGLRPLLPVPCEPEQIAEGIVRLGTVEDLSLVVLSMSPLELVGDCEKLEDVFLETEQSCEPVWTETLFRAPEIRFPIGEEAAWLVFTCARPERLNDTLALFEEEQARRAALTVPDLPGPDFKSKPGKAFEKLRLSPLEQLRACGSELARAADQFLVRTDDGRASVLAGYPWFTDWGRDTMIALPGLCLRTGRLEEAADIIDHFLDHLDGGLIPNVFPEKGKNPQYNTIDATLWLVEAAFQLDDLQNGCFIDNRRWEALKQIVDSHLRGTHNGIRVDGDGLLAGGSEGSQLTWMDVKIDGFVPVRRHGKAVEIQGLWYNALQLMSERASTNCESELASEYGERAWLCRKSFEERFFAVEYPYPADVVDRDGPGMADFTLRPNMLIPFALARNILPSDARPGILRAAAAKLLTPVGLRSLDPDSCEYEGTYSGPVQKRDRQYHQGTVWMWLMGPYLKGVFCERERVPELAADVPGLLQELMGHFQAKGCLLQANEIFDGDKPHTPRGCFAQAWSVSALIEVLALPWPDSPGTGP